MTRAGRVERQPFIRHFERLERQLGPIREARLRQRVANQASIMEELALRNIFHLRVVQIRNEISQAKTLRDLMRAFRDTLENLGPNSHGPGKTWGINVYRYSRQSQSLWSVARDKLQGDSRYYPEPALVKPGEKRYFINSGTERGYSGNPTDILLVDRFAELEKMGPEDRAQAEADLECDLIKYFGADYREKHADRLGQLKEALRYNLYVRWPGFDQYDIVIMANMHVRNAARVAQGLPPEPLFRDGLIKNLVFESLQDLQIPFTSELQKVENQRRADLRELRLRALTELETKLNQGNTLEELCDAVLEKLDRLFPRSQDETYIERASIMFMDEEEGGLRIVRARGIRKETIESTLIRPGEKLAGQVFASGQPLLILDAKASASVFPDRASLEQVAKGSCMVVPIRREGKIYGIFDLRSRYPKAFKEEDLGFSRLIAEKLAEKMLRLDAENLDKQTGLYQRVPGVERINNMLEKGRKEHQPLGFIMIDLDRFKRINDTYGHSAGDKVIAASTRIISEVVRKHKKEFADHVVIRWGNGEEFVVAVLGANAAQAQALAEELRMAILEQSHQFLRSGDFITASFGIALYPDHGTVLEEVAHNADKAVYFSKGYRNRVTLYDPTDRQIRDSVVPSQ